MTAHKPFKKRYSHANSSDPFPAVELEISNCFIEDTYTTDSFTIDTGASTTCINENIFDLLDLEFHSKAKIEYADGTCADQNICLIDLRFPQLNFKAIKLEVVIHPNGSENLLGRDILNKLSLFLDGPQRELTIQVDTLI